MRSVLKQHAHTGWDLRTKACVLKVLLSAWRSSRGVTWQTPTTFTENDSNSSWTSSSISEPTTSGLPRARSFVPISRITTCGDKRPTTFKSWRRSFDTVRPPIPCIYIVAVPWRPQSRDTRLSNWLFKSHLRRRTKECPKWRVIHYLKLHSAKIKDENEQKRPQQ